MARTAGEASLFGTGERRTTALLRSRAPRLVAGMRIPGPAPHLPVPPAEARRGPEGDVRRPRACHLSRRLVPCLEATPRYRSPRTRATHDRRRLRCRWPET